MIEFSNYVRPSSLEEAWTLNQKRSARIIGGMMWMRVSPHARMATAIDLCDLGLDKIEETDEEIRIGCMTSLREMETNPILLSYTGGASAEAVRHIVGVQFRRMATVGGSIYGRYGFSDVLTFFLGLDTSVELYKGGRIPLEEFAAGKPDNDILVALVIRKHPGRILYRSVRNSETDFPVLTLCGSTMGPEAGESAVASSASSSVCRLVIGSRPARAIVVPDPERVMEREGLEAFGQYVASSVTFGDSTRASAKYRRHLARVLTVQVLGQLGSASGLQGCDSEHPGLGPEHLGCGSGSERGGE